MRPGPFQLDLERNDGVATIAVAGELDLHTLDGLSALVEEALAVTGTHSLILDLRNLVFMDSSGLRLLIELHDRARQAPWELHLVAPENEEALVVLRVTGADRALPFERLASAPGETPQAPRASAEPALAIELDRDRLAPAAARAAIASYCDHGGVGPETKATVLLLVSELVTNAVIHPDSDPSAKIRLNTTRSDQCLRVEVIDQGNGFKPEPRDSSKLEGGYGLYLLDQQAASWGVQQHDGNKVWFELALTAN